MHLCMYNSITVTALSMCQVMCKCFINSFKLYRDHEVAVITMFDRRKLELEMLSRLTTEGNWKQKY
jgi:hypothetical protein